LSDVFDARTVALVEAFQRSRGLPLTGVVDSTTWERLDEARWQLGQRLLYLAEPNLRGDDIAELQVLLAQLGFNPGRIDGIFGERVDSALSEFQRNCALEATGTLTKATLQELRRVNATTSSRSLVTDARDLAGFDNIFAGAVMLCGDSPLIESLSSQLDVLVLTRSSALESSNYANAHHVGLVLSLVHLAQIEGVHLHYWASYRSHSRHGELLASTLATLLARIPNGPRVEVTGMSLPILRETKMTTVHIEHGALSSSASELVSEVIRSELKQVFHSATH